MADKKVTQLTALTAPANTDLLLIVDDPTGTPVSKKIELGDLFGESSQTVFSPCIGINYLLTVTLSD